MKISKKEAIDIARKILIKDREKIDLLTDEMRQIATELALRFAPISPVIVNGLPCMRKEAHFLNSSKIDNSSFLVELNTFVSVGNKKTGEIVIKDSGVEMQRLSALNILKIEATGRLMNKHFAIVDMLLGLKKYSIIKKVSPKIYKLLPKKAKKSFPKKSTISWVESLIDTK
ncbi:hypothetical protein [Sphingobacterium multivorum]|uniref:hypothetical protein n=1 Tax=Sphingobacterium multivorum TaxID=28454 RepID=UPI003DA6719C